MGVIVHADRNKTVKTIDDRNNLTPKRDRMLVYVKDAIADINVGKGSALYRYDLEDDKWFLVSKSNITTLSFKTETLTIKDDQVTAAFIPTDDNIWNLSVRKDGVVYATDFDYTVDNGIISLNFDEEGQYDDYSLRFTYAYGSITDQINAVLEKKLTVNKDQEIIGDIVPDEADKYTLGTEEKPFKDLYVGSNSLYVNGNKVISNNDGIMKFTADDDQSVELNASGTGSLALTTEGDGDITINTAGTGNIELKGTVEVGAGEKIRTSDGSDLEIDQTINVKGSVKASDFNGYTIKTSVPENAVFTDTETTTKLELKDNKLRFTDEEGVVTELSMSEYIDDTNLARITGGSVDENGVATFTRDDDTDFTIDMSKFLDDTKLSKDEILNMGFGLDEDIVAVNDNLNTEAQARIDADDATNALLAETQTGAGLKDDGTYAANGDATYINEANSLKDADNRLDAQVKVNTDGIEKEVTDRKDAVDNVQKQVDDNLTRLKNEESNRADAIDDLQGKLDTEVEDRKTAVKEIDDSLEAEANKRVDADNAINSTIDDTQAGAGLDADGKYVANEDMTYINEASSIVDATNKLDVALKANADAVAKEVTDREDAIATVQGNVDTQAKRIDDILENADTDTDTFKEIVDLINSVDKDNDDTFAGYASKNDDRSKSIEDNLATETSTREDADKALLDELDAMETGAGLEDDGTYIANSDASYINEATSLKNADNKLDAQVKVNADDIAKEIDDRKQTIQSLQDEIDRLETAAGLTEAGNYVKNDDAAFISDADSLKDADDKLDAQLKVVTDGLASEVETRADVVSTLSDALDDEVDTRSSQMSAVNDRVDHLLDTIDCGVL